MTVPGNDRPLLCAYRHATRNRLTFVLGEGSFDPTEPYPHGLHDSILTAGQVSSIASYLPLISIGIPDEEGIEDRLTERLQRFFHWHELPTVCQLTPVSGAEDVETEANSVYVHSSNNDLTLLIGAGLGGDRLDDAVLQEITRVVQGVERVATCANALHLTFGRNDTTFTPSILSFLTNCLGWQEEPRMQELVPHL